MPILKYEKKTQQIGLNQVEVLGWAIVKKNVLR